MMPITPLIITCEGLISSAWHTIWPNAVVCTAATHQHNASIDLVLMVAGEGDWIDTIRQYRQRDCPVIVLSRHLSLAELQQAFSAGATGYVDILCTETELRLASDAVLQGALWVPPTLLNRVLRVIAEQTSANLTEQPNDPFETLSPREREVADAVCQGLSNKEVAQQLAITERTVKLHLTSIFSKLNIKDRMQLLLLSRQ